MNTLYLFSLLFYTILSSSCINASPLQKVYAFFGANVYQQASNTEYELANPGILNIENLNGSITISTETNQKKVFVSAIKKTQDEKNLSKIHIKGSIKKENNLDHLTLKTQCEDDIRGEVDYTLVVPQGMTLQLATQHGNVTVGSARGPVSICTQSGDITICKAAMTIKAENENGSITITDANGNITAITQTGDISIEGSKKSVIAQTQKGEIAVRCAAVPETARVQLKTGSGNVKLILPKTVNAAIFGQAEKGTLISDAFIDIKPRTTKLDKKAWKQFKQEVEGTIGSGEAEIKVLTAKGNIKISQTQTS